MAGSNKTGETQHDRFVNAAKEAGADTDTSPADLLMGRLAQAKNEKKVRSNKEAGRRNDITKPKPPEEK